VSAEFVTVPNYARDIVAITNPLWGPAYVSARNRNADTAPIRAHTQVRPYNHSYQP
jgi:hypothetical protein